MMAGVRFCFVILHYMVYDMTKECVECILDLFSSQSIHITIVDNGSSNNSGSLLKKHFAGNSFVNVLLNKENVGFAKGNNIGYDYALKTFNPNYMIVMNNDVLIKQEEFLDLIDKIYSEQKFDVVGPDIFSPYANFHQSPARINPFSYDDVISIQHNLVNINRHPKLVYMKYRIREIVKVVLIYLSLVKARQCYVDDYKSQIEQVVIHGACYIFSRDFFKQRKYAFNPATFLYMEEDILEYECRRDGLKILYDPRIRVVHLEDVSTNYIFTTNYEKWHNKNIELLKSINVLINLMIKDKGE